MDILHWELTVLSRAVAYNNLSQASLNVGLSQPQLSRIVAKIEEEYGVSLLDRQSKRKAAWTLDAFKVAETYNRVQKRLSQDLVSLFENTAPKELRIGALEGLIDLAVESTERISKKLKLQLVELDLFDLTDLESQFLKGNLDLVLTSREPGKKKYKHSDIIGYQSLSEEGDGRGNILSSYEYLMYSSKKSPRKSVEPFLVSNSLAVRKLWIREKEGHGRLPSEVRKEKKAGDVPVYVVAQDTFPKTFWNVIREVRGS